MILNAFETYVYLAGALAIGVLAIEVSEGPTSAAPQKQGTHEAWGRSPKACNPQPISISTSLSQDPWGPTLGSVGSKPCHASLLAVCHHWTLDTSEQVLWVVGTGRT